MFELRFYSVWYYATKTTWKCEYFAYHKCNLFFIYVIPQSTYINVVSLKKKKYAMLIKKCLLLIKIYCVLFQNMFERKVCYVYLISWNNSIC